MSYQLFNRYMSSDLGGILYTDANNKPHGIPIDSANTDYQQFKKDLANGVELKDAEGNQMTPEQITTFMSTLP